MLVPRRMIASSPSMMQLRKNIRRLANAPAPVLIRGETGVGKELVARALHDDSARRRQPFEAVNCSAFPLQLAESMLFGHERGAFTGAERRTPGAFERAGGGTLFLDEIGEMSIEVQAKLLRVLEDGRYRPIGGAAEQRLQARIVAATHADLERRINAGSFREDLYYRLNVASLEVPSLSERRTEIPELVARFVGEGPRKLVFTDEAMEWLVRRPWRGNVRELRSAITRVALFTDEDIITVRLLEAVLEPMRQDRVIEALAIAVLGLPEQPESKLDLVERVLIEQARKLYPGNKAAAARLLGIDRRALDRRLARTD